MTRCAFSHVPSHTVVSVQFRETDRTVPGSLPFGMFVSIAARQWTFHIIVALCLADASIGLLFLEFVWASSVRLLLVPVCDEVCHRYQYRRSAAQTDRLPVELCRVELRECPLRQGL